LCIDPVLILTLDLSSDKLDSAESSSCMAIYVTDHFTGTDGDTFAVHVPDIGSAYIVTSTDGEIRDNKASNITFGAGIVLGTPAPSSADYKCTATFSVGTGGDGGGARLMLRMDDAASNGYVAGYHSGLGTWHIATLVSGSFTSLVDTASPGMTFSDSRPVEFECIGDLLTLTVDGSLLLSVTDSTYTGIGKGGFQIYGLVEDWWFIDAFTVEDGGGGGGAGTHIVTGRGSFSVSSPAWLSTSIADRPGILSNGAAEPPNWYHVGMLSWGTENGAMVAYPVTRDLDLVQLPPGMDTVWYEFNPAVTATIVELASP
jgi:hypothetical protein